MKKENKRGRSIINVFDIVLIALAVVLAAVYLISRGSAPASSPTQPAAGTVSVSYTVEITELDELYAGDVKAGEPIVDRIKKYNIGTVESVETEPAMRNVDNRAEGTVERAPVPGCVTLYVNVTAQGVVSGSSIVIDGGYELKVGLPCSFKTPGFSGAGAIVRVGRIDQ